MPRVLGWWVQKTGSMQTPMTVSATKVHLLCYRRFLLSARRDLYQLNAAESQQQSLTQMSVRLGFAEGPIGLGDLEDDYFWLEAGAQKQKSKADM